MSLVLAFGVATSAVAFTVPPLSDPVVDQAGILNDVTKRMLNENLRRLWQSGGSQLAVLTVPSLDGLPIEQASIQVTDAWKLGTATKDNGVLLLISRDDRAVRIEVGQGHEGDLTDAYSRRIIDDVIVPRFRDGDFDGGVIAGVARILQYTDRNFDFGLKAPARAQRQWSGESRGLPVWLIILIVVILLLSRLTNKLFGGGRSMGSRGWNSSSGWGSGSSWGSGRSSGWGGGGGGFGGGGGGFSGGGASGRW